MTYEELEERYPCLSERLSFGFEIGPGWLNLTQELCRSLEEIRKSECPLLRLTQVKEKWGSLRVYIIGGNQAAELAIDRAENLSRKICEQCGDPGEIIGQGWLKARCQRCSS
jgi:hypothetical protein